MGTWAEGNFDNDSARDWLAETISDPLMATINECLPDHDEGNGDYIMAAVETLAVVCERLPVTRPERDLVQKRHEYAEAQIPEYWIVNPLTETVLVYPLKGKKYPKAKTWGRGTSAVSFLLPDFSVSVDEVFDAE